jgi:G3E family GTPase
LGWLCAAAWPLTKRAHAGKTTLLRHVLVNSKEKIACIVNDVASINIDAKLVRNDRNRGRGDGVNSTADLTDTIELQNGCACE